jgi:hypothetical protein
MGVRMISGLKYISASPTIKGMTRNGFKETRMKLMDLEGKYFFVEGSTV